MATREPKEEGARVRWDDSQMKRSHANVCNVASSREEVVLLFGTHHAGHAGQKEIRVELTDRVVMTPYAANRLLDLLENVLKDYESRFGKLPDPQAPR